MNAHRLSIGIVLACILLPGAAWANHEVVVDDTQPGLHCVTTTFEGGGDFTALHPEGPIPGTDMQFEPGWFTLTEATGFLANTPSGVTGASWDAADPSKDVTFVEPVASVACFYSSFLPVTLEAFDSSDNLLATVTVPANVTSLFDTWDPLAVDVGDNLISRVTLTSAATLTALDDFGYCQITCAPPEVACFADLAPDDECTLAVSWEVIFSPGCEGTVEAVIDIGCDVIPVENGQIVEVECAADDDDCASEFEDDGVLEIESAMAILIVTATDIEGNETECVLDLCSVCVVTDE